MASLPEGLCPAQPGKGVGVGSELGPSSRAVPKGPFPACLSSRGLRHRAGGGCPRLCPQRLPQTSIPRPGSSPHLSAAQLQASGLPSCAELTVSKAVACYLALEGADVSYANHRGLSPLDLVAEGHVLKALQGCAQRFR